MTMKTRITPIIRRALSVLATLAVTFALLTGTSSCDSAGTYWGVDQNYPIGNGNMYYGAYGGSGHGPHHGWSKKEYKRYKKYQKKREKEYRKQREKAYRKQMKKAHKHWRHHDDDDD